MQILHFIYDHICNPWISGGGAVRVFEIYRRLAEKNNITVICGKYPGSEDYCIQNLAFHFVGTYRDNYIISTFSYALKAFQFLKKHGNSADIVIEDFAPYNPLFSRFIVSFPPVLQVHHREGINLLKRYSVLGLPFMVMEEFYTRLYKNVICISEASKKKFKIPNAMIIPNGIDNKLLKTESVEEMYISFVGRIHLHNKGLNTLIKAMKKVNTRLAVTGKGRDVKKMLALVEHEGIGRKFEYKGYLAENEKQQFIAHSIFLVLPSRYEGQGIVILEAAACGKPVIVSDIPELKYAVEAGFGISFRTNSAEDLEEKINLLLKDNKIREEMGQKAREFARNYTWDNIADQYEKFLIEMKEAS